jgi:hypothetical protein
LAKYLSSTTDFASIVSWGAAAIPSESRGIHVDKKIPIHVLFKGLCQITGMEPSMTKRMRQAIEGAGTPGAIVETVRSGGTRVQAGDNIALAPMAAFSSGDKSIDSSSIGENRIHKLAAVYRWKYREPGDKVTIHPSLLGFHPVNRDGLPPNGERCDQILCVYSGDGYDPEEAERGNLAVRSSGSSQAAIAHNVKACSKDPYLASCPEGWAPAAFTIGHSHTNQSHKNVLGGCQSSAKRFCNEKGFLDLTVVRRTDAEFAFKCETGLSWEMIVAKIEVEEPNGVFVISCAQNTKNGVALLEHEFQALVRLCKYCALETDLAGEVCFLSVQQHVAATMPDLAQAAYFTDLFGFVVSIGGLSGPFLSRLRSYFVKFVNPKIRRLSLEKFAQAGKMLPRMESLCIAMIVTDYAADRKKYSTDGLMNFIKSNDFLYERKKGR